MTPVGHVTGLFRYPVKSMGCEAPRTALLGPFGLRGDRAFALFDAETGALATARDPRNWNGLLDLRPELTRSDDGHERLRIGLPDGTIACGTEADLVGVLSRFFGRKVRLERATCETRTLDGKPTGAFFDSAPIHLVTTATLGRLAELTPDARFDARRFRPNLIAAGTAAGFAEDRWVGCVVAIGPEVRLRIEEACKRCVMTTVAQADLPKDPEVLRTAVRENGGTVGVYATVLQPGRVSIGDVITLAATGPPRP